MHQQYEVTEIWEGEDRRKPVEPKAERDIIFLQLMVETRKMLEEHERKEAETFSELRSEIKQQREASEERHREVTRRLEHLSSSTSSYIQENGKLMKEIHEMFKAAFPDGDPVGHRRSHEDWIEEQKTNREFWAKTKQHVVQWGIVVALGWVGIVLWTAFLQGPK